MRSLIFAAALAVALTGSPAYAQDAWIGHSAEIQAVDPAVRAPLEAYLRGQATGNAEEFALAFHPDAELWGMGNGTLRRMSAQDYISRAAGAPPADGSQQRRWIETIDITQDTAVAKIVLDYPTMRFTDYMALARIEGRWVIVNKLYQGERKAQTP